MNCQVKDELVSQLIALNNKLNLLSPDLVHGDEERAEVQQFAALPCPCDRSDRHKKRNDKGGFARRAGGIVPRFRAS